MAQDEDCEAQLRRIALAKLVAQIIWKTFGRKILHQYIVTSIQLTQLYSIFPLMLYSVQH